MVCVVAFIEFLLLQRDTCFIALLFIYVCVYVVSLFPRAYFINGIWTLSSQVNEERIKLNFHST
jgi:hypothetical protein